MRRTRLAALCLALGLPAAAQDDAPVILIPDFTAPAAPAGPDRSALTPEELEAEAARIAEERQSLRYAREGEGAAQVTPALAPLLSLRTGASPGSLVRMQGENPMAEFSIYLPREAVPGQLRISTVSGVDVLPDRSLMEVTVNGTIVGQMPLGASEDGEASLFDVPASLWRRGRNDIAIRLEQTHRLFCGPEAAFDLWTDIDLAKSGALLDDVPLEPGAVDFLAAVAHDAGVGLPVGLRDPQGLAEGAWPLLDEMSKRLTELLRGRVLSYEASNPYGTTLDPDAESEPQMARITLVPTLGNPSSEFRRGGDGALVLVIGVPPDGIDAAAVEPFLDDAFADIAGERHEAETRAVQSGIDPRTRMAVGEPVTLESLGMPTTRTVSHYFRRDQIFTLPRDWLVLTAQKAVLNLDYIYARNLPEKSMMLIRINGETIRLLPLTGEGGELIEQFPIKFYANLLREGPNLIQFEALIPGSPSEAACPEGRFPKLEIRGSSTLTVPSSPALRLSGLRLPVLALRSDAVSMNGEGLDTFDPADRMSLVATLGPPVPHGSRMDVLSIDRIGELPLGSYDIARPDIAYVLTRSPDRVEITGPAPEDRIGELPDDLFGPLEGAREPAARGNALTGIANSVLGTVFGTSTERIGRNMEGILRKLDPDASSKAAFWLANQAGKAMLLQLDERDPRQMHLLLGPRTSATEVAASIATARRTIGGPSGQISVLGHDNVWRSWQDTRRLPTLVEPLTIGNFRQVAGAYASWSPLTFAALLFGVAFIFAMIALRLVILTRGEEKS